MKNYFFTIISLGLLISCSSTKDATSQKNEATQPLKASEMLIESNTWELITFKGQTAKEAGFTLRTPHIVINKEKGSMGGNSGCNSFNGSVEVSDNTLKLGIFMATKMYCDGVPEQEFFKLMKGEVDYRIIDNKLLLSKDGNTFMEFQLKEEAK